MDLEPAHIIYVKPIWRSAEKAAEPGDMMQVSASGRRGQIADGHVFDHAKTQRAHFGHLGFSCLRGLAWIPNLLRQRPHRASTTRYRVSGLVQCKLDNPDGSPTFAAELYMRIIRDVLASITALRHIEFDAQKSLPGR
jgi:hypothetical protein